MVFDLIAHGRQRLLPRHGGGPHGSKLQGLAVGYPMIWRALMGSSYGGSHLQRTFCSPPVLIRSEVRAAGDRSTAMLMLGPLGL